MITNKTLRGVRKPKTYVLSGVRASDGDRLDQNINRNFGAELAKLSREKSELQQGLGGGNTMATYKFKRFSAKHKTYTIKRKTFGLGDVVNNTVNTTADIGKKVAGTGLEVAGGATETVGKVAKPIAGIGGGLGGAAIGAALGPLGMIGGAILGSKLGKGAADVTRSVGESIKDSGQDLKGL